MDIFFKIKRKKIRFISSFFSALTYLLGYSVIMESGNFSVYYISKIHYIQTWVNMQYANLMQPFVLLFLSIFSPLSGVMETLLGSRLAMLSSSIIIELSFIFLYFQGNIFIFYTLSLFLGVGCGLSANICVKNCCFYYPKKKGLISALIMSLGAMTGSSYTYLGEKIINPDREKVIDKDKEPYYRQEIAERSKYYFLFAMIAIPIYNAISLFLFYKYDPSCEIENDINEKNENKVDDIKGPLLEKNDEDNENKNENEEENKEENKEKNKEENKVENKEENNEKNNEVKENEENEENKDIGININEIKNEDNNKKENNKKEKKVEKIDVSNSYLKPSPKKNIKKALKNWRFWRNILISGVMPFGLFFIFNTFRAYASLLAIDGKVVGTLAPALNIIGSTFNPVWAFLTDKYGFQPIIRIMAICIIGVNVYFFIFMDNKTFYVFGLYVSCIFRGGVLASITPHIMQIYGLRCYLTLGGCQRLFNQLISFIIGMLSLIFSLFFGNASELLLPYRMVCVVGVVLAVMGLFLIFFETDEKFNFEADEEKIEETETKEETENKEEKKESENIEKEDNNKSDEDITKKEGDEKEDKMEENKEEKKEENEEKKKDEKNEEIKGDENKNDNDNGNNKEDPIEEQNNKEKNDNVDKDEEK